MANRILLGKGSGAYNGNTKNTRQSSSNGLWISKAGADVLTCTDEDLIFASDASGPVGGNIDGATFKVLAFGSLGPYSSASLGNYKITFPVVSSYVGTSAGTATVNGRANINLPPLILYNFKESEFEQYYLGSFEHSERVNGTKNVLETKGMGLLASPTVLSGGYSSTGAAYTGTGQEYGLIDFSNILVFSSRYSHIANFIMTDIVLRP